MQNKNDTMDICDSYDNYMDGKHVIEEIRKSRTANQSECFGTRARIGKQRTRIIGNNAKYECKTSDTSISKGEQTTDALCNVSGHDMKVPIYRHTFTEHFMEEMYCFSKIHQYDDRHSFKEAWTQWTEEKKELILCETRKLVNDGYEGNVMDKMFKSARYYFRKKSTEKKEPRKRRNYIGMSRELLESIDKHIYENIKKPDYKPSDGYNDFYEQNIEIINNEIANWTNMGQLNQKEDMIAKIKKTYKNRYFVITKNKISN